MNDMERRKFEENFQDAFKKAEVEPSGKVWTNIELDLIKAEGERMKRRVFFYQLLAAASISFAVLFAGISFYAMNQKNSAQIALRNEQRSDQRNAAERDVKPSQENNSEKSTVADSQKENGDDHKVINDQSTRSVDTNGLRAEDSEGENRQSGSLANDEGAIDINDLRSARDNNKPVEQNLDAKPMVGKNAVAERKNPNSESNSAVSNQKFESRQNIDANTSLTEQKLASREQSGQPVTNNGSRENGMAQNLNGDSRTVTGGNANNAIAENTIAAREERQDAKLPALYSTPEPKLVFPSEEKVEADPVALMFARLNDLEKELAREESTRKAKSAKEKLWTSVGFAAGAFSSITPSTGSGTQSPTTSNTSFANSSIVKNQTKASGMTYTLGVSMGTQVAERWVIQGGFNYLTQMSDYTSTQAIQQSNTFKAASLNELRSESALDANEKFVPTAPYTVNSSNEYISVPLQAGYLMIKRKFVWQLNAGLSTDLFIQNTIDPEGNLEKSTSGAGSDSPYRSVNFSGLVGSEISYRFGDHYRLGLNPGIRYPLNSIYKDNLGVQSTPLTFDVGLRFRYIFR